MTSRLPEFTYSFMLVSFSQSTDQLPTKTRYTWKIYYSIYLTMHVRFRRHFICVINFHGLMVITRVTCLLVTCYVLCMARCHVASSVIQHGRYNKDSRFESCFSYFHSAVKICLILISIYK